MTGSKSIFFLIALGLIVVVAAAAFLILNPTIPSEEQEAGITPPEATGQISDLVEALEKEIVDEMNLVYEEPDVNIITSDAGLIDDFGQAADDAQL